MLSVGVATCMASIFGFGEALLLVPILTPLMGLKQAVILVSLFAAVLNIVIVAKDWRKIRFRSILPLLLAAACCVPIGIYIIKNIESPIFKQILGVIIIAFSAYRLSGKKGLSLQNDRWAWLFGAVAGTMGGAYNIAGPPAVMYATLRGWDPATFRASLQGFFMPLSLLIVINHLAVGNYDQMSMIYFAWAFPLMVIGIVAGNIIHHRIQNPARFHKYIYILLLVLGTMLWF